MGDADFDIDMAVSSIGADAEDVGALLHALSTRLGGALGARLRVEHEGGFRRKSANRIRSLSVQLGDDLFDASIVHGSLSCTSSRVSGGVRIRTTKLATGEWLHALLEALHAEAATSEATRLALESLVIGDS